MYHDSLAKLLSHIYVNDQKYKKRINEVKVKYERDSKEYEALIATMIWEDSINLVVVTQTIDHYGWLSSNEIGSTGNSALWLVIQHAELPVKEKYFPVM